MVSEDYNRVNIHSVDESPTVDGIQSGYYNQIIQFADPQAGAFYVI
jgi:hypothetical protein